MELPPLLQAALELRAKNSLSKLFLPTPPENMSELSPGAQAVFYATCREIDYVPERHVRWAAIAALRAAVDKANPEAHIEDIDYVHQNYVDGWKDALDVILNIADELERQS